MHRNLVEEPMSGMGQSRRFDPRPATSGMPRFSGRIQSRLACLKRARRGLSQHSLTIASFREARLAKAVSETFGVRCVSEW